MIIPFGYQKRALDLIIRGFEERIAVLAVMATGLGKTIISALFARGEIKRGRKGLFLCHENGILGQAMTEFRKVLGEQVILKPFYGSTKDFDADIANMVFASFQTYVRWKEVFFEDEFDFIIVDESHHGEAPSFKKVIIYFKPKKLLGITATPDRMDLKNIRKIFGSEVVNYTLEEAIAKGWLTSVEYRILNDGLSHWKLKRIMREARRSRKVSIKQVNETIFIRRRDEEIARIIQEYAGADRKTIIFCERIEHADNFQRFLPNALAYHTRVPGGEKENKARLAAFREGSLQYILAVNKFNEGIDVPDAELIVFLRSTDSKTIFYQQLGRGLRKIPGKEKVTVLDFVANCERLAMIRELTDRIKEEAKKDFVFDDRILRLSGKPFTFEFTDEQLEILDVVRRINEPFYETWQEASRAAVRMKIGSSSDYAKKFRGDPKLPSHPSKTYKDFPGWPEFLNKKKKYYLKWEEASVAAIRLGIKSSRDYEKKRYADLKLHATPNRYYANFPGWVIFLSKQIRDECYRTWQEAGATAVKLGIRTSRQYLKERKIDRKLPAIPDRFYPNFPGWVKFLGKSGLRDYYRTWQKASRSAIRLKIRTAEEYRAKRYLDPQLPGNPRYFYEDFPGWDLFLKTERFYRTWEEAGRAAKKLRIVSMKEYRKRRKEDPKLPILPEDVYLNFPGWIRFLGKTLRKESGFYVTWQQASKSAIKLGVVSSRDYRKKRGADPKLPGAPDVHYKDFPGWNVFLGLGKEESYLIWRAAAKAARKLGIRSSREYKRMYKKNSKLPATPDRFYKDFPGWDEFLDKFYATWQEASIAVRALKISSILAYRDIRRTHPRLPSDPSRFYKDFPGWKKFFERED